VRIEFETVDTRDSVRGWFFTTEQIERARRGDAMINPSIDLSNPCNLNCPYCYIEEKNSKRKIRRPNELSFEEIVGIIGDFASAGALSVNIVGAGEPTIDPAFEAVISAIADANLVPVVFTNGILLAHDDRLVDRLYAAGATIVLKYNSADKELQDLVAGRRGYARKRDAAREALLDRGFSAHEPTRLALDIMAFRGNLPELPVIHRWCRTANVFPIMGDFIPTGRTESGRFAGFESLNSYTPSDRARVDDLLQPLSADERRKLYEGLAEIDRSEFGIKRPLASAYYGGGTCTQILGLYVDIQGDIWPCVARSQVAAGILSPGWLGNVRNGDLPSEIWRSHPYMRAIRERYDGGCPYKERLPVTLVDGHLH
jgi:MoaA/NifB/PqqE/SkfB family radical SAM enzyme